jgi:hypothetical protein
LKVIYHELDKLPSSLSNFWGIFNSYKIPRSWAGQRSPINRNYIAVLCNINITISIIVLAYDKICCLSSFKSFISPLAHQNLILGECFNAAAVDTFFQICIFDLSDPTSFAMIFISMYNDFSRFGASKLDSWILVKLLKSSI